MRLQKYLADAGIASRRKCEELIAQGRVCVNGVAAQIGMSVDENADEVTLDGKKVAIEERRVVIMLNKPIGMVSTANDPQGRKTVADLFSGLPYRVHNIGRLDINSEGLLLMTNDGELTYKLTHPKHMIEKTYHVICSGKLSDEERQRLECGIELDDGMTAPANVDGVQYVNGEKTMFYITIHEGRNRQVRRMVSSVGHDVLRLRRVQVGPIRLGTLKKGEWRYLTESEIEQLYSCL